MGSNPPGAWSDDNGLRWYTFKGEPAAYDGDYMSVTSQRKVLGMAYNLHEWVLKQLALGVIANPEDAIQRPGELIEDVVRRVKKHATKKRDESAERGTTVHGLIAGNTDLSDWPTELRPYVISYAQAVIDLGIKPLLVERQVFNTRYRYAGSFDLLAYVKKYDKSYIVDLKTGSGTYPEHAIQCLCYLWGNFVATTHEDGKPDSVDEGATALLHEARGIGILHITPDGYTFHDIAITAKLEQAYKAQCVLAHWYGTVRTIEELEVR